LAIWQHLGRFLAIFSLHMCRNGYFSWHSLGRIAIPSDHNDPVYPEAVKFHVKFFQWKIPSAMQLPIRIIWPLVFLCCDR